jgi:hypothetical protein
LLLLLSLILVSLTILKVNHAKKIVISVLKQILKQIYFVYSSFVVFDHGFVDGVDFVEIAVPLKNL